MEGTGADDPAAAGDLEEQLVQLEALRGQLRGSGQNRRVQKNESNMGPPGFEPGTDRSRVGFLVGYRLRGGMGVNLSGLRTVGVC